MPPFAWWLSGRDDIATVFGSSDACAGDRLVPIFVNATIGYGQYRVDDDGVLRPFAITALYLRNGLVAHSVNFLGAGPRFVEFGLPEILAADR